MSKTAVSLFLMSGFFQACIFVASTDDDPGIVDVSWETTPTCDVGSTINIVVADVLGGDPYVDRYDCSAGIGLSSDLPLGTYDVWLEITDLVNPTEPELVQSPAFQVTLTDFQPDAIIDMPAFLGYFGFTWEMTDGGQPATCASVSVEDVEMGLTLANTTALYEARFTDCESGTGVTDPLALGDYLISAAILDSANASIAVADTVESTLSVGNQTVEIAPFIFEFQ